MSAFSADEDKSLLLLAVLFDRKNGSIDWEQVISHMPPPPKTVEVLQQRLEYLKATDTSKLRDLPAVYVKGSCLATSYMNRTPSEIYEAIESIFGHLTKADLRQPSGRQHLNAGEVAPVGISAILEALFLKTDDVFVDIGSGSGCILAQVVLQSPVSEAIGLEIRQELAQKSLEAIEVAKNSYPRLHMVTVIEGDVKKFNLSMERSLTKATVMFSNNMIFQPQDNLALMRLIERCQLLRAVLLTEKLCARCSLNCTNKFCRTWKEEQTIVGKTCWKDKPLDIFLYKRRPQKNESLLSFISSMDEA